MAAEDESGGEKTERPSDRRMGQARSQGTVAKSYDLSQVIGLIGAFVGLQFISPYLWMDMQTVLKRSLTSYTNTQLTQASLNSGFHGLLWLVGPKILLLMLIAAFFGAGCTAIQTKFLFSLALLRPKFRHISPLNGIKRILSIANLVNLLKSLAKLAIIGPVAYFAFAHLFPQLIGLMDAPIAHLLPFTSFAASYIFRRIVQLLFILAIADYAYQWWITHRQLKMTKVEVKEEHKATEGDESMRMAIRSKGLARARQRMLKAVKKADVVVTNPTHLSVALSYDPKPGSAPKVVAKGRGYMALRIREIAIEAGVPVVERKPLARALFKSVEVDQIIPYELYAAVAELLAYVYKLKGRNPFRTASASGAHA
jgi:flagellar biosynthesis protein FlhB